MFYFLIPLLIGFCLNLASAFTFYYTEKWGKQTGTFITILLRDIFGIPLWAIGFLFAIRESEELLFARTLFTGISGWVILSAGGLIILIALISIRKKAAAPATGDSLVNSGLYSYIRHPIHAGTFLEFAGLFILWPSLAVGIASLTGTVWILFQSRFEEMDLQKRIPGYSEYMHNTPPFFPAGIFKQKSQDN